MRGEKATRLHLLAARGLSGYKEAYEKPLTLLLVMVGVILVIACGNVSLLLAARNTARRREFSVRLALGGTRGRLFRQLLVESLLLVLVGAALGWLFAIVATQVLAKWSEIEADLTPDWRVLAFTLAISLVAGIIAGLAPMLGAVKVSIAETLKTTLATAFRDQAKRRVGQFTTALQVALCLVLLVGAALLVRTLENLKDVDLGFRSESLLVFGVTPHLPANAQDKAIAFYRGLIDKLRSLPQVEAVTLMQNRLGSQWSNNGGTVLDGKDPHPGQQSQLRWNAVGPNYFGTLRIRLVEGRDFNDGDTQNSPKASVVNRTFVDRYLKGRSALGHTVSFSSKLSFAIVGVAADSKYTSVQEQGQPMAYFPYTQISDLGTMHVEVRTPGNPKLLIPEIQRVLASFAPDLAMLQPMTQREQFDESITGEALIARLSACFGLLAVTLVATGLYGTIAYNVNRRTSELGIRLALGASRGRVLWMILREGLQICAVGLLIGLPLALAAARLLRSLLYGLTPSDPRSISAAVLGILVVTMAACLIPARRAASIDPAIALRNE